MISRRKIIGNILVGGIGWSVPVFAKEKERIVWDQHFDVVIAGAGAAGLSAAVRAAQLGSSVAVFEKMPHIGGNTALASGYVSAPWPKYQEAAGIVDSIEKFRQAVSDNAGASADPTRIARFANEVRPTLEWLEDLGLKFQPQPLIVSGEFFPRAYRPLRGAGTSFIRTLSTCAMAKKVQIITDSEVKSFIQDRASKRVLGVEVKGLGGSQYVRARRGVLVASGGFCASDEMIARFAPRFSDLTHNNASGCTGELILAAEKIGADLVDMDKIQCQPGAPQGRKYRVRLHNESNRFILINHEGRRFIREDDRRDRLRDAVLSLPQKYAFALIDHKGFLAYTRAIQKETVWGVETGDAFVALSLEELAKKINVSYEELVKTIQTYNDAVNIQRDVLGKDMTFCQTIDEPPFWAALAGMTRHASQGGIRVDEFGQVLCRNGTVLEGLWAAGEVTGGLHGNNQMGGDGLSDALTFGRLAAEKICAP